MPADLRPFRRFFDAPLRFDADMHAVAFNSRWLSHELPAVDPELQRLLSREIARLEQTHGDNFPDQIRTVLRSSLSTGTVSAESVAGLFSMHPRTLARRLEELRHGASGAARRGAP